MKTWFKKEYFIVGIDEAGRGPLAGPLAVAAVVTVISRHVQRGRSDVAGRVFLFQNNRSIHRQIREKKTDIVYFAVCLNILAIFINNNNNFFARLGHIKPLSYLSFFAGFAFQPRNFRSQFCVSFFQFYYFLFYFFGFNGANLAFSIHFHGGKNKRQKNSAKKN